MNQWIRSSNFCWTFTTIDKLTKFFALKHQEFSQQNAEAANKNTCSCAWIAQLASVHPESVPIERQVTDRRAVHAAATRWHEAVLLCRWSQYNAVQVIGVNKTFNLGPCYVTTVSFASATSAPIEHLFSASGLMLWPHRAQMAMDCLKLSFGWNAMLSVTCGLCICLTWVSKQFLNGTSAQYILRTKGCCDFNTVLSYIFFQVNVINLMHLSF